jgi:hypothetical protein
MRTPPAYRIGKGTLPIIGFFLLGAIGAIIVWTLFFRH